MTAIETTGALMKIVKGRLVPSAWAIECPVCNGLIEIEHVGQDDSGLFFADEIDTAPDCPTCAVCVESDRVEVRSIERSRYKPDPNEIPLVRRIEK